MKVLLLILFAPIFQHMNPDQPFEIPDTYIIDGHAYATGVSRTTEIFCHERSDKERMMDLKPGDMRRPKFEVRMGIAMIGYYNRERRYDNPFHPNFDDNYVKGEGNTELEAVESLVKEVCSTADSLWEF